MVVATALRFNGWANYNAEVYRMIARLVPLIEFTDDELTKEVTRFAPQQYAPAPRALCERLMQTRTAGSIPVEVEPPVGGGIPLMAYRRRLASLPRTYQEHLREAVRTAAFFDEMFRRHPDPTPDAQGWARKACDYWPEAVPMACACLFAWEMQDGRCSEEIIEAMTAEEHGAKEAT
jgi:hypothetical protein